MIIELDRCPYCGGDGELYVYSIGSKKKLYLVRCEDCGNGTCADDDALTVVKAWNARADSPNPDEMTEEAVKTIYISLPRDITENSKYQLQKRLCEEASDYLSATVELIESYPEEDSNELEILAVRLKSIGEAEYVIFPDGWELSRESRIEYETAIEYGKKILTEHGEKLRLREEV